VARLYGVLLGLAAVAIFWLARRSLLKTGEIPGLLPANRDKSPVLFKINVWVWTVLIVVFVIMTLAFAVGLLPLQP
jgi:hypothetical protein